jgi:hypothetical protein
VADLRKGVMTSSDRFAAMKKPKDPETTKAAILEAGLREFAAEGFNGARIEQVAAGTNLNKRRPIITSAAKRACILPSLRRYILTSALPRRDRT